MGSFRLGVDVGGAFTDFTLVDEETGETLLLKVPSTPADPSDAIVKGWERLREELCAGRGDLSLFDFGPPLEQLLANCEEETGLEPPRRARS